MTSREWFSKPAGIFLQLLAAVAVIGGIGMLASGDQPTAGVVLIMAAVALFWLGRQT